MENLDNNKLLSKQEYILNSYRWINLLIFSIAAMINQVAWISLSPVADQLSKFYNQSNTVVNSISLAYNFLFIVFNFPSNYIIDTYGVRIAVLVGIAFTCLGMCIKCFINFGFYICIIGQVITAIGQPFLINCPAKMAAIWFGENERVIAITICVVFQAIGVAIGFLLPSIWVTSNDSKDQFMDHILIGLIVQAGISILITLACILFLRDKPENPPSAIAFKQLEQPGQFLVSIKSLLNNKDLILLMLVFGLIQGVFNTLGTIIGEATSKYGYNNDDASQFGALFIVGGIIGSGLFGVYVEKTKSYKFSLILICFFSTLACLGQFFFIPLDQNLYSSMMCFFQGVSSVPIMVVAFDYGVEITFPLGESYSTGILMSSGQIIGITTTILCGQLIQNKLKQGTDLSYIILISACFLAMILSLFLTNTLKRHKIELKLSTSINEIDYFNDK